MERRAPGTRVRLDVPEGFDPSSQFHGFENPAAEASIGVTELPTSVHELRRGLQGTEIVVDGRPAILVEATLEGVGGAIHKAMLVLGDATHAAVVVATSPVEAGLADVMLGALRSVRWTPDEPPPTDDLPWTFGEHPPLRLATRMGAVILLTEAGTVGLDASATMMTIGAVPLDRDRDLAEVASDHLGSLPGLEEVAATAAEERVVHGAPAFEIVGEGLSVGDARPIRVYQIVVRHHDREVIAVGRAAADRFDAVLDAFRAVGRSIR